MTSAIIIQTEKFFTFIYGALKKSKRQDKIP
jgi:hypothetical protein